METKLIFIAFLTGLAALAGPSWVEKDRAGGFKSAVSENWKNLAPEEAKDPRKPFDPDAAAKAESLIVLTPECFPGWVARCRYPELTFFRPEGQATRGPTRLSFSSDGKAEVYEAGKPIPGRALAGMDRPWVLVWFADNPAWGDIDMPFLLVFQHRPATMEFASRGLRVNFGGDAGYICLLPLFGHYRPPRNADAAKRFASELADEKGAFGLVLGKTAPLNVLPYEWEKNLPSGIVKRCDYLSGVCRAVPLQALDFFQLDLKSDTFRLRYKIRFLEIADDWKTPPTRFAPIPPTIALATRFGLPGKIEGTVTDPIYPTPFGPWTGIENADTVAISLNLGQYLSETYKYELNGPETELPTVAKAAVARLTVDGPQACLTPATPDAKRAKLAEIVGGDRFKAIAMGYVPAERTAEAIKAFRPTLDAYRQAERYSPVSFAGQEYWKLSDAPDAKGAGAAAALETLWLYAYNSGDYEWMKSGPSFPRRLTLPATSLSWAAGDGNAVELGLSAGPALSYARLMYVARDQTEFCRGAYWALWECLSALLKCGPMADYARSFQPWDRNTPMSPDENAALLDIDNIAGWVFDGPTTATAPELWRRRWIVMTDFDFDRFLRENATAIPGGLRAEFDAWSRRHFATIGPDSVFPESSDPTVNPATLLGLYREFLGESLDQLRVRSRGYVLRWPLLRAASLDNGPAPWIYWAFADKKRYERLLDAGETLPFVPGLGAVCPARKRPLLFAAPVDEGTKTAKTAPTPIMTRPLFPDGRPLSPGEITPFPDRAPTEVLVLSPGEAYAWRWPGPERKKP